MEAARTARSRRFLARRAKVRLPAPRGRTARAALSSRGALARHLVGTHRSDTLVYGREQRTSACGTELLQARRHRRSSSRTGVDVAREPSRHRIHVAPVRGLVTREQRDPGVQQAKLQVFPEKIRLRGTEQSGIGAVHLLDPDELPELTEQLLDQPLPQALGRGLLWGGGLRTHVLRERQGIDAGDHLIQLDGYSRYIEVGSGLEALDVVGESLAQRQELRASRARKARVCVLKRSEGGRHVADELQLLRGDGEDLLDVGEHPVVAAARELLVERFEAGLMVLILAESQIELGDLRERLAHRFLSLFCAQARVAAVCLDVANALSELCAQDVHPTPGVVPLPREEQRNQRKPDRPQGARSTLWGLLGCGGWRAAVLHVFSGSSDRKTSYSSKKSRHLRDGALIAPPGDDDLANVALSGYSLYPGMGNEHGRRAQVSLPGRPEHREAIREPLRAGDRNRIDCSGLPSRQQGARVGLGTSAPIAFRVFDLRASRLQFAFQPSAAALSAEDDDRTSAQLLKVGERRQRFAVALTLGRYHVAESPLRKRFCGARAHGRNA